MFAALVAPDLDGNIRSFGEFVGKAPLIVNFWGTWCPPCKREMPDLKRIYDEYKPHGLEIIGLSVRDTPQQAKDYVDRFGYDWVMLMATRETAITLGLGSGVPYTVFIDRNGNMLDEKFTGMQTYEEFKRMVEKII
jgi:thiol-disulfide isomerase/thioredoxin